MYHNIILSYYSMINDHNNLIKEKNELFFSLQILESVNF